MPSRRIREDHGEYRDIVKGNVDEKLKKHIKGGQRVTRRGKDFVVVRVPHVELPTYVRTSEALSSSYPNDVINRCFNASIFSRSSLSTTVAVS